MMKRLVAVVWTLGLAAGMTLAAAGPASAQVTIVDSRQSINFNLGYFALKGADSRVDEDVLLGDLDAFAFDIDDFNGATFGGEWLFGVTEFVEAGVGAGFYQRTVPSVYAHFTHDDDTEIAQDLKLRVIPLTATVRFLPLGRGSVQPYVGAGIGLFNWRYSEVGEFVDFSDDTIFPGRYIANGTAAGPVILGGIRAPIADVWMVGGEIRYQNAKGDVETDGLPGTKLDLGGWTTSFTVGLRF